MKKVLTVILVTLLVMAGLCGLGYYYQDEIYVYYQEEVLKVKDNITISKNDYFKDNNYEYVQNTDDFIAKDKKHLKNIFYTIINSGIKEFTFYCDENYTNCQKDIDNMVKDQDLLVFNNHMETSHILSRVKDKQLSNKIFDILDTKDDITYYSLKKTKDRKLKLSPKTEEGVYMLNAINSVSDEMYNQDFIVEEATTLLEKLNSQNGYIPSYLIKENNKNLSTKTKEYQKTRN